MATFIKVKGGHCALQRDQLRPGENTVNFVEEEEDQMSGSAPICLRLSWSSEFTLTLSGNTLQFNTQSTENKTPGNNITERTLGHVCTDEAAISQRRLNLFPPEENADVCS